MYSLARPFLFALDAERAHGLGLSEPGEGYLLFRIGDCVAQRNTHAAIYDALRLCKDF